MIQKIKNFLLYITNNQEISKDEAIFDILFFIIDTLALIAGIILFNSYHEPQWIPIIVIEYIWALDNMRHNRP